MMKRCPQGHAIGRVRKDRQGVHYLEYFDKVLQANEDPAEKKVVALIYFAKEIVCSECNEMVNWHFSKSTKEKG